MCLDRHRRRAAPLGHRCSRRPPSAVRRRCDVAMVPPRFAARSPSRADRTERVTLDGRAVGKTPSGRKRNRPSPPPTTGSSTPTHICIRPHLPVFKSLPKSIASFVYPPRPITSRRQPASAASCFPIRPSLCHMRSQVARLDRAGRLGRPLGQQLPCVVQALSPTQLRPSSNTHRPTPQQPSSRAAGLLGHWPVCWAAGALAFVCCFCNCVRGPVTSSSCFGARVLVSHRLR